MVELTFSGLNIATFSYAQQSGNASQNNLELTLNNVQAIGTGDQQFTLVQTQASGNADEFSNGQFWQLIGPDGSVLASQLNPGNDLYQGLGATDEYIIFQSNSFGNIIVGLQEFPVSPQNITYTQADEPGDVAAGDNDGNFDFEEAICFGAGTLIATPTGYRPIEALKRGDLISTRDNGAQPLVWTASSRIDLTKSTNRDNAPILIRAGAFGPGQPASDLVVSPQHLILLSGWAVELNFGFDEAFAKAKAKAFVDGLSVIAQTERRDVTYYHLLCDRHEIITANGLACETFHPGKEATSLLSMSSQLGLLRATLGRLPATLARPELQSSLIAALKPLFLRQDDQPMTALAA